MFPVFALIFLIVPIVEIYFLIQVGEVIGALWTIIIVIITAVIGVRLLKIQGLSTMMRAQQKMNSGQMPAQEMMEGLGIVIAGAFLLTPGFVTDAFGFLLLIPVTRSLLVSMLVQRFMKQGAQGFQGQSQFYSSSLHDPSNPDGPSVDSKGQHKPETIEGVKYKRED